MSFNNIVNIYSENNALPPSKKFNKTYSIFNKHKFLKPHKTSSTNIIKNIKSSYKKNYSNEIFKNRNHGWHFLDNS